MKKKILSLAIVAAVAVAAAWSFNKSSNNIALSDVALSNVEALAQDEGGTSSRTCYHGYDAGGSLFFYYVDCRICIYTTGTSIKNPYTCRW